MYTASYINRIFKRIFHLYLTVNIHLFCVYKSGQNSYKYFYECKKNKCSCASAYGRGNTAFGQETFLIKQKSKILSYHVRLRSHSAVDTFSKIDLKSSIFKLQKWFRYQNRLKFNFQSNAPMCPGAIPPVRTGGIPPGSLFWENCSVPEHTGYSLFEDRERSRHSLFECPEH